MRSPVSVRKLLLVTLLVVSNLAFASHAAMHISTSSGSDDWCICQGQTPAVPLPAAEVLIVERHTHPLPSPVKSAHTPDPDSCSHQPRAPPSVF